MDTLKLTKKYQTYPEYKDSGAEWLGKIPNKWDAKKIASVFDFPKEKVTEDKFEALSVTYGGIKKQIENAAKVAEGAQRKLVKVGDIAINGRSDRKGAVGVSEFEGGVSLVYNVLRKRSAETDTKYFHYLMRSTLFSEEFYRWGRGIVDDLWTTRESEMKRIFVTVPDYPEQRKIVSYLDEKTALIDQIIEKKKRFIELLREKRAAVINHAVTKGLDPNVELVDSGIDWIGKIPKEWRIRRIKDVSSYCSRGGAPEYVEDEVGLSFINQSCIRNGSLDFSRIKLSRTPSIKGRIRKGDILVNSTGTGTLGRVGVFDQEGEFYADTHVTIVRLRDEDPSFLMFQLQNSLWQNYLYASSVTGSTNQIELSRNRFLEIPVILPSISGQRLITNCLKEHILRIDKAVEYVERSTLQLVEFKSSLISHVVTGKIKV